MDTEGKGSRTVLGLVFVSSLSGLAYEIALMRLFSISLWYHFGFMVISIAMLGIGAAGTALSILPGMKDIRLVCRYGLLFAFSIPASYLIANTVPFDPARLSWDRTQLLMVGIYYIVLSLPFFCFGLIVSTVYSEMPGDSRKVYFSDLAGAGAGALGILYLLSLGGPDISVFVISCLPAAILLTSRFRAVRIPSVLLIVINISLIVLHPSFIQPRISPYKPYSFAMQFPGAERLETFHSPHSRVDLFRSPAVRFAPGLSLTYLDPLPAQTGVAVDAGDIYAITDDKDQEKLSFVGSLPSSLAYRLGSNNDVLVIEPRAGLAVLTARQFGADKIYAVDSNPLVIDAVRQHGLRHGSRLYTENTAAGLARTWLAASGRYFDVIDLSLMGPFPSSSFGFAEDYRYTVEAFRQYLSCLKPDGFISISQYILPPPRTELRILSTLSKSGAAMGIDDISGHLAAIRSWDTVTIVMKRSPLTYAEISRVMDFAHSQRFDLVYYPGIGPDEGNVFIRMPDNKYAFAFKYLLDNERRGGFMTDYLFDIRPVTDDRPFFHYYLKAENIQMTYQAMGRKWQYFIEEGCLLPLIFIQVFVISAVLILLPLLSVKNNGLALPVRLHFRPLSYFAALGVGYLFIEMALIQKMVLLLEHPSYAASTVIASVLISSGLGSLSSQYITALKSRYVIAVLGGVVLLYIPLLTMTMPLLGPYPLSIRIVAVFFMITPVGFLMGIPFPLGMSVLGSSAPVLIPWAWSVNGCFSVLAPVMAVIYALSAGYKAVLITGALMYFIAFGTFCPGWNKVGREKRSLSGQ